MPQNQTITEFLSTDVYTALTPADVLGASTFQVLSGVAYVRFGDATQPAADAHGLKIDAGYGWVGKALDDIMPSGGHTRVWVKALTYPTVVLFDHA